MADSNYEIVFRGDIAPGNNLPEVKERFRQLFKADDAQLEHLFSGRPVVVKRGLDKATSERYRDAIAGAGGLVEVRLSQTPADTPATPSSEPSQSSPVEKGLVEEGLAGEGVSGEGLAGEMLAEEEFVEEEPAGEELIENDSAANELVEKDSFQANSGENSAVDEGQGDTGWGVAPVGADVLTRKERTEQIPQNIDTSHLSVAPPGADVLSESERSKPVESNIDISHINIAKDS